MRGRTREPERVLVIGAGLVGSVLAIYLARRGLQVTIYEASRDCRRQSRSRRPSLSLSLCTRGVGSLARIGAMGSIRRILAPAFGRMIHAADGSVSYQPYSAFGEAIHCVNRRALSIELLDAAEEHGVEILFERRCVEVNPASGEIAIESCAGTRTRDRARSIFAADGCHSAVRHQLQRGGWCRYSHTVAAEGYKEFRLSTEMAAAAALRPDVLHGWPRQHLIAGAFPEPDGSLAGTLHMPTAGAVSFASMADRRSAVGFLEEECPDLLRTVPDLAEQLAEQRPNSASTVLCRPWSAGGKVLLVGDAAHAMLPYYGQGANAGFQDCEILDGLIERHGTDWMRVFREFETIRKPDTDAMAELCEEHLAVLRDGVSQPDFQSQWRLEQWLHRLVPDAFTPLYSMIAFSPMPYAEARRRDRIQQEVVRELLRDPAIERAIADPVLARSWGWRVRRRLAAAAESVSTRPPDVSSSLHAP